MKRYLLFTGDCFYPCGGWDDFRGDFDSVDAAKAAKLDRHSRDDWFHIVDTETMAQLPNEPR